MSETPPMTGAEPGLEALRAELSEVRRQLAEAQEVIRAIQSGEVDAVVVDGPRGSHVYTLENADSSYRALVEAMNEGAAYLSPGGEILYCNKTLSGLAGMPLERVIGQPVKHLFAGKFRPALDALLLRTLSGETATSETELIASHGRRHRPVHLSFSRIDSDEGVGICMVVTDLTEQREREKQIADERKRLFEILETLPVMASLLTPGHQVKFANRMFRERFGEAEGRACYEVFFGRQQPCELCESFTPLETGKPHWWEVHGLDGSIYDCHHMPFTDTDGSKLILEMDIDVTEQRRAEAELKRYRNHLEELVKQRTDELEVANRQLADELALRRLSEEKFARAFADNPAAIALARLEGMVFVDVNETLTSLSGYSREEMIGHSALELNLWPSPEDAERLKNKLLEEGSLRGVEQVFRRKSGEPVVTILSVQFLEMNGERFVLATAVDATRTKQAEQALRESEEQLRRAMQAANAGSWKMVPATGEFSASDRALELNGFSPGTPMSHELALTRVYPDDRARVEAAIKQTVDSGEPLRLEHRVQHPDGSIRWVATHAERRIEDGQARLIGLVQDITERKQGEKERERLAAAVQQERDRLSALIHSATDEIWFVDTEKKVTLVNPSVWQEFGRTFSENPNFETMAAAYEYYRPDGTPRPVEEAPPLRALKGEMVMDQEEIVRIPATGQLRHRQINAAPVRRPDGAIIGSVSIVRDITERKREEARRVADIAALTRMHKLSWMVLEAQGIEPLLKEVMDAAVAISGAQRGTLQLLEGDSLRIVAHHGHEQSFLDFFAAAENCASVCGEAMRRGERVVVPDVEESSLFAGTASLPVLRQAGVRAVQSTPMLSRAGKLLGILTTQWNRPFTPDKHDLWRIDLLARQASDLIEQARAEEALRASEARFRTLADAMPQLVWTANANGTRDYYNARRVEYDITATASGEYDWRAGIHPDDLAHTLKAWNEAAASGSAFQRENRLRMADGSYRWHLSRGIPVRDESGKIIRWFGTATDIEDLKQAEAAIREAERIAMQREQLRSLAVSLQDAREEERARLARDLHDDIGQILTAIKMELNWVEKRLVSPTEEMMERIKSAIDLTSQTVDSVRKVCSELRPAMLDDLGLAIAIEWQTRDFSARTGIPCEISVPAKRLRLKPASATAMFRIHQECLTNVMRHAQARSVGVTLYERNGSCYLRVEDDGKGFDMTDVSGSLGLLGMKERARGCGGELEIESSPGKGTIVTLKVPK